MNISIHIIWEYQDVQMGHLNLGNINFSHMVEIPGRPVVHITHRAYLEFIMAYTTLLLTSLNVTKNKPET